jgi:hypothetical protein
MSKDVSNEVNGDVMLNEYVTTTNQLIGSVKKYNKKLFDQVKKSYSELYDEKDKKVWNKYKVLVDLDNSTINKIVKIMNNDSVMRNYDRLPGSWGTLSVLTTMEEKDLMEVIESGRLNPSSTKKEVMEIRDEYQGKQSSGDTTKDKELEVNQLWINLDELNLSTEERVRIEKLFQELEGFGFTIINDKDSQSDDS